MKRAIIITSAALALAAAALAYQDGNATLILTDAQVKTVTAAEGKAVTITLTRSQREYLGKHYPNAKVTKMTLTSANVAEGGRVSYMPPDDSATVLTARTAGE